MQTLDKFKLALGVFWSLVTLYFIISLFSPMDRRLRELDVRLKHTKGTLSTPKRLQRIVFILLASLMSSVILVDAFHRSFAEMTGIGSGTVCILMIILPALYFTLGLLEKIRKKGHGTET
jgi:hypothetical protein